MVYVFSMKKNSFAEIILVFISIPFGFFLAFLPNTNSILAMGNRIGHSFILTGIMTLIINISDKIRKKSHSQSINELISLDQGMFLLYPWKIIKDTNKLRIELDKLSHYIVCLVFGVIGGAITYIILPRIINFEPSFMFSTPSMLIWLMGLIDFCAIVIIFIVILITTHFNIMKIIDPDENVIKIIRRKQCLTIPFSNLSQIKIFKNEIEGFFELSIPIAGNSGDLSIIKNSLRNNYVILIQQQISKEKGEEILNEIMSSINDFFEKFSI